MTQYRDIFRHSAVYGVGQILARLASIVLLPLYTHYLRPADYGVIAILDLTTGALGIVIGGGMAAAVSRFHFQAEDLPAQNRVWWTGLTSVLTMATLIVALALPYRRRLATMTLGSEELAGGYFYALALSTLWFNTIMRIPDQYLRVRKWSWLSVTLALATLFLNVALNVYFLSVRHMGIAGVLWGNFITGATMTTFSCALLAWACGRPRFHWPLTVQLWRFGGPIVIAALLATVMHQADRYLLRLLLDLEKVGVYSFAYTIGQGINTMILVPFSTIFSVVIYEIAQQPEHERTFARLFEYFVYGLTVFLLGVSLFVKPMLALLVPADYVAAGTLVPIVCLAFVFYSIHDHFKVPAMLANRTQSLVLPYAVAASANVAFNLLLIPVFGAAGAAWTSVVTYAIFSAVGLIGYRRIEHYDYPLRRCTLVLIGMIASYVGCEYLEAVGLPPIQSFAVRGLVWSAWASGLTYWVWYRWPQVPKLILAS